MARPSEKLAESLEILHALQERGVLAIRSADLSRTHRERLRRSGYLQEVIKGWHIPARPDELAGESTAWYASFWPFCSAYFRHRFDAEWCLSPEQSLSLHAENWTVPNQLLVRANRGRNKITKLPHGTSFFEVRAAIPGFKDIEEKDGMRIFSLSAALIACATGYFRHNPIDMRAALSIVRHASEILERLLEGGHSVVAGRLAGALRNIGSDRIATDIIDTMRTAGYDVREHDPFKTNIQNVLHPLETSPCVNRIRLMWQGMRERVIERFPRAPGLQRAGKTYLKRVEDAYATDAYHSLSIEGYRVSPELIDRVRSGDWNPDAEEDDRDHRNTRAARGYWLAYQAVCESIARVLRGDEPGSVANDDHRIWYREMFGPGVRAGLLKPADLAGYRNDRVHIRRSMHVPPRCEAVRDAMPALFDLLREETEVSVRVVLGHFIFVYIHPYMDGNGRMGRFLMNVMAASGGYPWIVVPLEQRDVYMRALEKASVDGDIVPFTDFLARLVKAR